MANGISSQPLIRHGIEGCNQALEWWLSELREMPRLVFRFRGKAVVEFEVSESGELGPSTGETAQPPGGRRNVRLKLDDDAFLYRKIKLPAAVRKNVERVIGYEFNKYFPMDAGDALFSCSVIPAPAAATSIEIEIWAINRTLVDRQLSTIRRAHDLEIRQLGLANRQGRVLITRDLEKEQREAADAGSKHLPRVLNLLIAGLLAVLLVYPVARMDAHLAQQQQEIDGLEKRAQPVIELRAQIMALDQRFHALADRKRAAPAQAELWSRLTRSMSQRAVLDRIVIDGRRVQVTGKVNSVESLLRSLESEPRIDGVEINGPVKAARDPGYEILNLSLAIRE